MPQRFLRPGLRTSQRWNSVSRDAQALWLAILMVCDDYGRYDGRDSVLCADAFSVWNEQNPTLAVNPQRIPALRSELTANGLAFWYESDGKSFVQITQWQERARGKSKFPDPPQDSAGFRSGTQPNPASLVLAISHKPSPEPSVGLLDELQSEIGKAYKRPVGNSWSYMELSSLSEISRRPKAKEEWLELLAFRQKPDSYFPRSIQRLLQDWDSTLDRARNHTPTNGAPPKKSIAEQDIERALRA